MMNKHDQFDVMKNSYLAYSETIPVAPARKQYSSMFNLCVDQRVHRALAVEVAQAGISLNALVVQKLALSTKNKNTKKTA